MKQFKNILLSTLFSTITLFAGFTTVDCTNQTHLDILKVPQIECEALDALWEALGNGKDWGAKDGWDTISFAGDWHGITMHDNNSSIQDLVFGYNGNHVSGYLPDEIGNFTDLRAISILGGPLTGGIPVTINNLQSLETLNLQENQLSGSLPILSLPNLWGLQLGDNSYSGTIPLEYSDLPKLSYFGVARNNLFGALPNFSNFSDLSTVLVEGNNFTFNDIEPHINVIKDLRRVSYWQQSNTDVVSTKVYFYHTLKIEPSLVANPSKNDHYVWKKDNEEISVGPRIYTKLDTDSSDAGYYFYDVTNSQVTLPNIATGGVSAKRLLTLRGGIDAIYNVPPTISNTLPTLQITEGETYNYDSNISDEEGDKLFITLDNEIGGLNLTSDEDSFTLTGTPPLGNHDIIITVTDGKIPVHINFTLNVNPSADSLPAGFTFSDGIYTHTATGRMLSGDGSIEIVNDGLELTQGCVNSKMAFISLDSNGLLSTGFKDCTSDVLTETFTTELPNNTKASIVTNNSEEMVLIKLPLGDDMTLGGK